MRFPLVAALAVSASLASAQTSANGQSKPPVQVNPPAPIPTGVVPLPTGSPQTGQQGSVPPSIRPWPKGDPPPGWTADLEQMKDFVAQQPVSLDQAIAISLYASRPFAAAVANLQQVSARTGEARSELFPTLGVNGNLTYYDKATTVNFGAFGGSSGAASSPPLVVLPQFNPVFTAALSLPLDVFGSIRSAVSQAQFNEVAARIDVNRVRNQTVYDVKNAFYNVLRASAQEAVAEDTLNNALGRLVDANKNYSAGTSSRFDITTAQRDVADAQQGVITAKAQVSSNLAILKNVMGLDVTARLSIRNEGMEYPNGVVPPIVPPVAANGAALNPEPGKAAPQNPLEPKPAPPIDLPPPSVRNPNSLDPSKPTVVADDFDFGPEYDSLLREAYNNRPEVLESEAQVTAARRGLQFALRSALPSFSVSLEDIYTPNATPLERRNQEALVLGFSIPIFDGGLARARTREQRGLVAEAEANRRQARGQVLVDIQQAYIALVQSRQRVAVANVEVSQARESFRVSRVRYLAGISGQVGVSPQLELSNAQTSLAQAQSNLVNALYDYNNARAQLDRAAGRYSFTGAGPGYLSKKDIPH